MSFFWPLLLVASLVMGLAIWFLQRYDSLNNLGAILPAAAFVYFGTATLLGTIPRQDMQALYTSIRHKANRTQTAGLQAETTSEEVPFLTDEDMQPDQEFLLVLGREMTNPLLPAYKYEMTKPLLPIYYEVQPPGTPRSSEINDISDRATQILVSPEVDNDDTVLYEAVRTKKGKNKRQSSSIDDDDEDTVPHKAVRPTKGKNASQSSTQYAAK